jgi:hypothetical protein
MTVNSAFCYSCVTHINGIYVCVLGIPKGKFSKQMKKIYNIITRTIGVCFNICAQIALIPSSYVKGTKRNSRYVADSKVS